MNYETFKVSTKITLASNTVNSTRNCLGSQSSLSCVPLSTADGRLKSAVGGYLS